MNEVTKWGNIIVSHNHDMDIKEILKRMMWATIPGFITSTMSRLFKGHLYVKFQNPSENAMSLFLKHRCYCIHGSENYAQNFFTDVISSVGKKDVPVSKYYESLKAGNIFISKNKSIIIAVNKNRMIFSHGYIESDDDLSIYIIGINFKKDLSLINKYYNSYMKENGNSIYVSYIESSRIGLKVKPRDTIFSDQKDELFKEIDKILYKFNISKDMMISATSAVVLHGKPGTGKSLLSKAVVKYILDKKIFKDGGEILYLTRRDLYNRSLVEKDIVGKIRNHLAEDDQESINIIVIDDCDMIMKPRGSETESDMGNLTADLMGMLDNGIPELHNPLLVIMTTNFINKIDPAILRPGRTDLCMEISDICESTARRMCEHYKVDFDIIIKMFPDVHDNGMINPAKLQQLIIKTLSEGGA